MLGLTPAVNGLHNSLGQFNQAANNVARAALPVQNGQDSVDLSTAAVSLIRAKNSFEANTKVFKVADELDKTLLNTIG
jgi:flagellar basal body rod protein FlgG